MAHQTEVRDRLLAAYAGDDRGYHDTRHLVEVLDHLDLLLSLPGTEQVDHDAVVLAAWFHDAVYDGDPDDEERSAQLAERTLREAALPAHVVDEVARLVRLTRHHAPGPDDVAGQVLTDADLAILAAGEKRYAEYRSGVRREFAHLDERTFAEGRTRVLRELLAKPVLFHTSAARQRWEERARANLAREIDELSG